LSGIFISYRRAAHSGYTGAIYDRLSAHFGADRVHVDVDTIEPGEDFAERIETVVAASQACVVVIAPGWLEATDEDGNWRLGRADDLVRREIEIALQNNVPIFPTLVGYAEMPRAQQLPESIRLLARSHAVELSDVAWIAQMDRLICALERRVTRGASG
jgi:TIR domain